MPQRYVIVAITALAALWLYIDRVCFSTLAEPMKLELLLPHAPEPTAEDTLSDEEVAAAKKRKRDDALAAAKKKKRDADPSLGKDVELTPEEIAANPALAENVELTPEEIVAAKKKKWADRRMSRALGAFFFTYALFQIPMGNLADRYGARKVLALSIAAWSLVTMATGFVMGFVALLGIRLMLGITEAGAYPAAAGLIKRWAPPEERGRCSSIVALGGRIGGALAPWLTALLAAALVGVAVVEWVITPMAAPPSADGKPPPNWRGVFVVYGFCGLAVAVIFWFVVRDKPPPLSLTSPLEGEVAAQPRVGGRSYTTQKGDMKRKGAVRKSFAEPRRPALPPPAAGAKPPAATSPSGGEVRAENSAAPAKAELTMIQRIGVLAQTRNMWLFGGVQFGVNLGWAFIVTLLPTYLNEAFGTPLKEVGPMQSAALLIGLCGMILGGVFTDWLRSRLGPKLGRSVPICATLSACSVAFLIVPTLPTAWAVVVALGVMAFFVDLHNPSIWSFAQDVGGKNVGTALGWGNMWGNLGAALSPVVLTEIRLAAGWNTAFVCCAVALAAAAVCGMLLDATKPVEAEAPPVPTSPSA